MGIFLGGVGAVITVLQLFALLSSAYVNSSTNICKQYPVSNDATYYGNAFYLGASILVVLLVLSTLLMV